MSERFTNTKETSASQARSRLLSLEKTGKFVFHGSSEAIDGELQPRQAYQKNKEHGSAAISATPFADIAIFRAVINNRNFPEGYGSRFGISKKNGNKTPEYNVSDTVLDLLKNSTAKGYVYVLDKQEFSSFEDSAWEVRATQPTKPVQVIEVSVKDLPEHIYPLDRKIVSPELSFSGKELDFKFKNLHLTTQNPKSPELKVTFQKESMEFKVGESYGPMEEVLFDGVMTEKMNSIIAQANELQTLPEGERLAPLLGLLKENVVYPFPSEIERLKAEHNEKAQWVEEHFSKTAMPKHMPLSEVFEKGYGICSHLSIAYLWLAQKAGLQGTCAHGIPHNVMRADNQERLFKNYSLGELVPHMWVEIKLSNREWIAVDPSTGLIGNTQEARDTFKNAQYRGVISDEITMKKTIGHVDASLGNGPLHGFPAGDAQCQNTVYVTLRPGLDGKIPENKIFLGTVDFKLKIDKPKVTNFKILSVLEK